LKHDNGNKKVIVVSLTGLLGAINKVINMEFCPYSAIISIKKIRESTYLKI
jgi:hypothetical protein